MVWNTSDIILARTKEGQRRADPRSQGKYGIDNSGFADYPADNV